ncbi:g7003 [Coccomyxa viridis]|uniref:G7003 protein n=1 Tax=Coccomyxa viridis TaxID=1274662 RepID=A0ABP1G1N7_9CHLO
MGVTEDRKINTVLVLVAMEAEALPLINILDLKEDIPQRIAPPAPAVSYSGNKHGVDIHVVRNGKCQLHGVDNVGTVPAAVTAYLAVHEFKPDLVISVGTAGGFKAKGAAIGDVFMATAFANHDRRIPIPGFDKYGVWRVDALAAPNLKAALKLKEGVVSSGNSLDYSKEDWDQLESIGAAVKEMEAAGISWVTHLHDVPFIALKAITDIVDGDRPAQEEFLENLHAAAKALQDVISPVMEFVAGKSIKDL